MTDNFADRLLAAVREKGAPVCVGLDPVYDRLPDELKDDALVGVQRVDAIWEFCIGVLEAAAAHVPAVKIQSAYFEVYRQHGVAMYYKLVRRARELGLLVIGDVKRNDIGSTAAAYAEAHLAGEQAPDAVTVNGYFGADGLAPFVDVARDTGRGVFVLVRTSNPSAGQVQDFADAAGTKLYEHVAASLAALGDGDGLCGRGGYSCVGAVVGATWPAEAKALRELMPRQVFLVPGYGAQGATAADCAAGFKSDGTGAIVNASRSVIYAHQRDEYAGVPWRHAVAAAARDFAADVAGAVGM